MRGPSKFLVCAALGTACSPSSPPAPPSDDRGALATTDADELAAFAKLYGYVRFFHPSDAAAQANWDALAIAGARDVVLATDRRTLRDALQRFVDPIAPTVHIYVEGEPPTSIASTLEGEGAQVAWQHLGFGFGTIRSAYDGTRVGRKLERPIPGLDWAPVTIKLDAMPLRGKILRLSARARAEAGGRAQLWLRVDRPEGEIGFFDSMADRPIESGEWITATIEGPIAKDATQVAFGGIASGDGQVWFDDFSLVVIETNGLRPIPLVNPDFELEDTREWAMTGDTFDYEIVDVDGNRALRMRRKTEMLSAQLFDELPRPGETLDLPLVDGLRVHLPISLPDGLASRRSTLELDEASVDADDPALRAAAVIVGWNVLRHFYPYFDVIEADWDAVLDETLADVLEARGPADLQRTLERMVAKLDDGHGSVRGLESPGFAPVELARVEGKVIVIHAGEGSGISPGDELLTIDGVAIDDAFAEATTRASGSPQWIEVLLLRWARITAGPQGEPIALELRRGDERFAVELIREQWPARSPAVRPAIEVQADHVVYVDLTRASWSEIEAVLPELAAAPGVVFDVRGYPNSNHEILRHLLQKPDQAEWMFVPRMLYPDQQRIVGWSAHGWELTPAEPHIAGKVVFITDARAVSYAESVMGFVEGYDLGEIVGSPTAGANGNINPFEVPGGFVIVFTGMKVTRIDGGQHHGIGVLPTIPATPTIAGIAAGRDELLEVALASVRE